MLQQPGDYPLTAQPSADADETQLRNRTPVAFLASMRCRISEALQLDRADWNRERVVVRGKSDIERAAVITRHAREEVERYPTARGGRRPSAHPELQPRAMRAATHRARCGGRTRRPSLVDRVTKLHPHRFRHTTAAIAQEKLGDPR